ncbi:MAG: insulinase family protein [Phycisphaerae bacterium]|nr:insulinase family protein [Phycisphaerae bacterium]
MAAGVSTTSGEFVHEHLDNGVEFAADVLPQRNTVALCFRMLSGLADEPPKLTGVGAIVQQTLSKGTRRFDGRGLADAFDRLGVQWATVSGRQTMLVRVLCLPEFVLDVTDLVAEMICHPTFPDDACQVAVELAQQELRHLEDEPQDLLRIMIQRLTLGPVLGQHIGGTPASLARLTPDVIRDHWRKVYHAGRLQVVAAGPVDAAKLARRIEHCFAGLGSPERGGRESADFEFKPAREHRHKELEQQYIGITLPGLPRDHDDFPVEQVLIGVLAGGMSGRLFTEVREKQGLVYWVGAWHEQPRGKGVFHLGASTTPERCDRTYQTLLRELQRVGEDLTAAETTRARDSLIAQYETEDDLTRARAGRLSDDLFHFGRPLGLSPKLDALRAVTPDRVAAYARRLPADQLCVATLGPRAL